MADQIGKHFALLSGDQRSGGLSTVRKGVDLRDGSSVAVKFVAGASDELSRKVFEREARALRGLSHPNIVRLRDAGVDETGTYFLILDWVDRSLIDLLSEPPWADWDDLYESLARPLVDGLAFAHLKLLEHRDIKPGNILIDAAGRPLIADFGIAKIRGDQPHSELTVQHFRSGPYAPPELEAPVPYVRDVYSIGVVLLQCLSETRIRDFPDVAVALESIAAPPDVRRLLEACVNPDPHERPSNADELSAELRKLQRNKVAREAQLRNPLWLELTHAAQQHLVGDLPSKAEASAKMQRDLAAQVFAQYRTDRDTGRPDRSTILVVGEEHRYTLKPDQSSPRLVVTAAPAPDLEVLEGGRRHGLLLPPVFSWVAHQPSKPVAADRARETLLQMLDEFHERRDQPDLDTPLRDGDEVFDLWLRILEAREELARGEHQPLTYKSVRVDGRRSTFALTEANEDDLIGTDWEVVDKLTGRKFGHGEVIDQESEQLTLLTRRPLSGLPRTATLVPYDAPSAISLNRQRNALFAIKNAANPGPDLRDVLIEPSKNAEPHPAHVSQWSVDLDDTKKRAVELALGAPEVLVVEGPPGTGKTRFITEAVIQVLRGHPDARVLIASQTHVAVDNAVERLHAAGVKGLVRLAGADESAVLPSVRDLLLDRQTRRWADEVRSRAQADMERRASDLGMAPDHLNAALVLEQLLVVTQEIERVQQHIDELASEGSAPSELRTAVEDDDRAERFQGRLEQLTDRRQELVRLAQAYLADDLSIPASIGSADARAAIEVLIGQNSEARDLLNRLELQAAWLERIQAEESLASIFLAGTSVVAGTCIGFMRNKAVGQIEFDVCILDEASKATLTEALVPMSRAKRWILVGDTRQLPPTDEELLRATSLLDEYQITKQDVAETLFKRLADGIPTNARLMLREQHRMVRPIGDLISSCFYDGQLRSPRTNGLSGFDKVMGATVTWLDTGGLGEVRREQGTTSYANRAEAQLVMRQLETIDSALDYGLIVAPEGGPLEVLAIAPYKSQVEDLRRRLAPKAYKHLRVSSMSVDAVQGREADLAIVSLTRSNSRGQLGFLGPDYWRRINVALSRARFGLVIIGDAAFIKGTHGALRTVLDYVQQHPDDCTVRLADRE